MSNRCSRELPGDLTCVRKKICCLTVELETIEMSNSERVCLVGAAVNRHARWDIVIHVRRSRIDCKYVRF